ncbi:MAG: LytR C-terminal domain-containing protein [Naasia sp.]
MPAFPPDRFDTQPDDLTRVGAHRAPKRRGRGFVTFAWAALATGVIVGAGVVGMFVINDRVSFTNLTNFGIGAETPTTTPTPTVEPTIDPTVQVVVLNSTTVDGLAGQAGDILAAAGFTVGTRGDADSEIADTTVYYSDPVQEGAAKGIVQSLGMGTIQLSTAFVIEGQAPRIVLVLGTDYAPAA